MNQLNSVLLEGDLAENPTLAYTGKGTALCTFVLVSKRTTKVEGEPNGFTGDAGRYAVETGYFNVVCYSLLAETCNEHLREGRGVRVVGRLRQNSESKQVEILAEHVEFKPERQPVPAADSPEEVNAEVAKKLTGRSGDW